MIWFNKNKNIIKLKFNICYILRTSSHETTSFNKVQSNV